MGLNRRNDRSVRVVFGLFILTLVLFCCVFQTSDSFAQGVYEVTARVRYVIDGDTIVLDNGEHVRYKGVNAPEIRHDDMEAEPFGYEALRRNRDLVQGKTVRLVIDRAEERDRHQRLIAQIFLPDGRCVQDVLVSEGLATVCAYDHLVRPDHGLLNLQVRAIGAKRGMWSVPPARPEHYYIGNRASMRFHRPSCPYGRQTSKLHTMIFYSREEAFKAGYCPCRRCLP
ncbi:MAG: thermonuclease family protein [Dissulfurimicrobium sp.]|uniref:thermonuclease family protein n=1 Tax=Dissulfurimicrobium TaxID=1769732 RepID=UPI001EDB5131|nr:thermonuclease family protein [Dissulfurimicrobium hydrothermale]UKL13490.1 thermonuclease family protein [Dissulfurimicrobium hydrothermale]